MSTSINQSIRLHLGCGKRYLPGWTHIDIADFEHINYRQSVEDLSNFDTASADEIYACNLLEHFNRHQVPRVLAEWARVLKPGGILRLSVPDFEAYVAHYLENHDLAILESGFIGGQKNEYDFHYYEFDFVHLENLLKKSGFNNVQTYDWRDFLPNGFDDYSRAYLPHMDFEKGRLMSLNVTGTRTEAPPLETIDVAATLGINQKLELTNAS